MPSQASNRAQHSHCHLERVAQNSPLHQHRQKGRILAQKKLKYLRVRAIDIYDFRLDQMSILVPENCVSFGESIIFFFSWKPREKNIPSSVMTTAKGCSTAYWVNFCHAQYRLLRVSVLFWYVLHLLVLSHLSWEHVAFSLGLQLLWTIFTYSLDF